MNLNPKTTAIILGSAIGAAVGAAAAWTYVRQQDATRSFNAVTAGLPTRMEAGAGDFIKIGISLLALVRQFDDLFKPK